MREGGDLGEVNGRRKTAEERVWKWRTEEEVDGAPDAARGVRLRVGEARVLRVEHAARADEEKDGCKREGGIQEDATADFAREEGRFARLRASERAGAWRVLAHR